MRIHCLQHVPFEDPANIAAWATQRGDVITGTRLFAGETPPEPDTFDWLVMMGGPMSVHDRDEHPWIDGEIELTKAAIEAGRVVIGVCFGAQIIARALGADVRRNAQAEIGWFPVERTADAERTAFRVLPERYTAFHWHGETFDVPADARHVARSAGCENQAFVVDRRVYALQFHLESTPTSVDRLITHCGDEITDGEFIQSPDAMRGAGHYQTNRHSLFALLDEIARS